MVDVSEMVRFTPGERTLRLVMDIAAALERYRTGPDKGGHWEIIETLSRP